jgi:hypothetical protein
VKALWKGEKLSFFVFFFHFFLSSILSFDGSKLLSPLAKLPSRFKPYRKRPLPPPPLAAFPLPSPHSGTAIENCGLLQPNVENTGIAQALKSGQMKYNIVAEDSNQNDGQGVWDFGNQANYPHSSPVLRREQILHVSRAYPLCSPL